MAVQISDLAQALAANGIDKILIRQGSEDKQINVSDLISGEGGSFTELNGTDLNTVISTGFYHVRNGINVPSAASNQNGYMFIIDSDISEPLQVYFDESALDQYTRRYASGAWGTWVLSKGLPVESFHVLDNRYGIGSSLSFSYDQALYGKDNGNDYNFRLVGLENGKVQLGEVGGVSQTEVVGGTITLDSDGAATITSTTYTQTSSSSTVISATSGSAVFRTIDGGNSVVADPNGDITVAAPSGALALSGNTFTINGSSFRVTRNLLFTNAGALTAPSALKPATTGTWSVEMGFPVQSDEYLTGIRVSAGKHTTLVGTSPRVNFEVRSKSLLFPVTSAYDPTNASDGTVVDSFYFESIDSTNTFYYHRNNFSVESLLPNGVLFVRVVDIDSNVSVEDLTVELEISKKY